MFLWFNRLFLSVVNKNNLKQIYVRSGKEIITQTNLYWFTLTPRTTSSPQKPLGNPLCNQNQITNTSGKPHQECWSWTPQEHTTLLGNTNTEIQKSRKKIIEYSWILQNLKFRNTPQSYSTSLRKPKSLNANLENSNLFSHFHKCVKTVIKL